MARQSNLITLKRGDSFVFTNNQLLDENQQPLDLTGWSIRSQIRTKKSELIKELDVAINQFDYSITSMDTTLFPIETLYWDIQYTTPDGVIFSSDTVPINVILDITF
jgi:hypothetical protein